MLKSPPPDFMILYRQNDSREMAIPHPNVMKMIPLVSIATSCLCVCVSVGKMLRA